MSAMSWTGQAKSYAAVLTLAVSLVLSNAGSALANSENASDAANGNYNNVGAIGALYDRCIVLSGAPHWTDTGWVSAPSAHRQGMKRLCNLANALLTDHQKGSAAMDDGLEGRIAAQPPVSRPSAFASACRDEARSGPHSLHALNWKNSPHKRAKVAICDQFERALIASYFNARLQ